MWSHDGSDKIRVTQASAISELCDQSPSLNTDGSGAAQSPSHPGALLLSPPSGVLQPPPGHSQLRPQRHRQASESDIIESRLKTTVVQILMRNLREEQSTI